MFLKEKHLVIILISLELMLLAGNFNFIVSSFFFKAILGQIYSIMILCIGACEASIGLAILIVYYRLRGGIFINLISLLKC